MASKAINLNKLIAALEKEDLIESSLVVRSWMNVPFFYPSIILALSYKIMDPSQRLKLTANMVELGLLMEENNVQA